MVITEYTLTLLYDNKTGEEVVRIRVKFENYNGAFLWSMTQLEGLVLGKWLPLRRYDFAPQEKPPVHIHKEKFNWHPQHLVKEALKKIKALTENKILDFIEKRKKVFLRERKWEK